MIRPRQYAGIVNPLGQSISFGDADAPVSLTANLLDLDLVNTYVWRSPMRWILVTRTGTGKSHMKY